MNKAKRPRRNKWLSECDDLIRATSGGFLFGIPLLYMMEVWQIGSLAEPPQMIVALAVTFIVVFLLNRTAGFRKIQDNSLIEAAMDSIEAIAIGLICSTVILILLREITLEVPLKAALGKAIYESVPFTLGVAVSNQFLSGKRTRTVLSSRARQSNKIKTS